MEKRKRTPVVVARALRRLGLPRNEAEAKRRFDFLRAEAEAAKPLRLRSVVAAGLEAALRRESIVATPEAIRTFAEQARADRQGRATAEQELSVKVRQFEGANRRIDELCRQAGADQAFIKRLQEALREANKGIRDLYRDLVESESLNEELIRQIRVFMGDDGMAKRQLAATLASTEMFRLSGWAKDEAPPAPTIEMPKPTEPALAPETGPAAPAEPQQAFRFRCPKCGKRLAVAATPGTYVTCPHCSETISVPADAQPPPGYR